jgi:hypothetical protein
MLSETLIINEQQVRVEYAFKNLSDHPITTVIAFPTPPFGYPWEDIHQDRTFHDFQVRVNERRVAYDTEVRAFVDDTDVTSLLQQFGIQAETFGGYDHLNTPEERHYQVEHLPEEQLQQLVTRGLVDATYEYHPVWSVVLTYHWSQTFPPDEIVRIIHTYHPIAGFHGVTAQELFTRHPDACLEESVVRDIDRQFDGYVHVGWVKYILTTANTWRTPIDDFSLYIEVSDSQFGYQPFASVCWDAPIHRHENGDLEIHRQNFIPDKELTVYFFERTE